MVKKFLSSKNFLPYEVGDLVSVIDNWWEAEVLPAQGKQLPLLPPSENPLVPHRVHGLIVDSEVYPVNKSLKNVPLIPEPSRPSRREIPLVQKLLYHVMLPSGEVKKYFHNRLEKISDYQ